MRRVLKKIDGTLLRGSAFLTAALLSKAASAEEYFDFKDAEGFVKNSVETGHSLLKSVGSSFVAIMSLLLFFAIMAGSAAYAVSQYNKKREMGQGGITLIAGFTIGWVVFNALSGILLLVLYQGASKLISKF